SSPGSTRSASCPRRAARPSCSCSKRATTAARTSLRGTVRTPRTGWRTGFADRPPAGAGGRLTFGPDRERRHIDSDMISSYFEQQTIAEADQMTDSTTDASGPRVGWIGTGRMGVAMAARLAKAGVDLTAWNRTLAKAEPLKEHGAAVCEVVADLRDRDVVFT